MENMQCPFIECRKCLNGLILRFLNKKIANSHKAICDIRLMATFYFLGPYPRRNFRYMSFALKFANFLFCSVTPLPFKTSFCGNPLTFDWRLIKKRLTIISKPYQVDGNVLFSRAVSSQISSTCESLTVVFGMGTSGSSQL